MTAITNDKGGARKHIIASHFLFLLLSLHFSNLYIRSHSTNEYTEIIVIIIEIKTNIYIAFLIIFTIFYRNSGDTMESM